jgi:hypothetical protein
MSPVGPAHRLALTIESRTPRPDAAADESGWAGLSGAAVFSDEHLVGVITSDPASWQRSLEATRLSLVVDDNGFLEAFGRHAPLGRWR